MRSAKRRKDGTVTRFMIGIDGRSANNRFREALKSWGGTQWELVAACNQVAGRAPDYTPPVVSQQIIDQIKNDRIDAHYCSRLDTLAEAMGFRPAWMRHGKAPKIIR